MRSAWVLALAAGTAAGCRASPCAIDPSNALRATCRFHLSEAGFAEVEITDGVETALFATHEPSLDPVVAIWGLHAEGPWTFTARAGDSREVTGELEPGKLPQRDRIDPHVSTSGDSTLVQFTAPFDCQGGGDLAVLDAKGRVRWYEPTGGVFVEMVQFTQNGTFLAIADHELLVEIDPSGHTVLRRDDYDLPIHHDVFREAESTWVLMADTWPGADGETFVEDVVVELDTAGDEIWRWEEHDYLDTALSHGVVNPFWDDYFPGAIDAWHTNGVFVTPDRKLLVSLYRENTVLQVSVPSGDIDWALVGQSDNAVLPSDFVTVDGTGSASFSGQHQPVRLPEGHLTVFDNATARALELELDEGLGTATFIAEWPFDPPIACAVQSSVFPLDGGHHLVTCADARRVAEYDAEGTVVKVFSPACSNGANLERIWRAQPMDLWGGVRAAGVTATRLE